MQENQKFEAGPRLATVREIPKIPGYQWCTQPALRHLLFEAEDRVSSCGEKIPGNGLTEIGAIIRIGRKILIDLDKFDSWVELHRVVSTSASAVDCNKALGNTSDPQLESKLVQAQPLGELPICKPGSAIADEERGDA
jgi:hypothetical protein